MPNYFKCSKEIIEDVVDQWVPLKINNQFGQTINLSIKCKVGIDTNNGVNVVF